MTKLIIAGFLLLQIGKQVLGELINSNATVECFDNSTHPPKLLHTTFANIPDYVTDLEVIHSKVAALGCLRKAVTDLKADKNLLAFNETNCTATSIMPLLKDNYLVLCVDTTQQESDSVRPTWLIQLNSNGKTVARVNIAAEGNGYYIPKGFAVDKKGNVYFGLIEEFPPSKRPSKLTGSIFVVKNPYQATISSKSISVLVKNVDFGGGLAFTDNDQTLLLTSSFGDIFKYNLKDYKVTRTAPTLFANVTQYYPIPPIIIAAPWHELIVLQNSILVTMADKLFELSRNGKTLLRTISIRSSESTEIQPPIVSIFVEKSGRMNIAFAPFAVEVESTFVVTIEKSYSSRARQDIVCMLTVPEQPTIVIERAVHGNEVA
ncbi:hypothetical protein HDU81_004752 [Chytriomyces hyalinus]|nr:hypothetical protein HDU81_004752 [Chytriomyces hyalinus]